MDTGLRWVSPVSGTITRSVALSVSNFFQVECSEYPVQKPVKKCAEVPKQTCVKRRLAPTCREVTKHICRQDAMSIAIKGVNF